MTVVQVFSAEGYEGEFVYFGPSKAVDVPDEPPPDTQTLAVTIRLTGALLQRQQTLGPLLAPAYVPPY